MPKQIVLRKEEREALLSWYISLDSVPYYKWPSEGFLIETLRKYDPELSGAISATQYKTLEHLLARAGGEEEGK